VESFCRFGIKCSVVVKALAYKSKVKGSKPDEVKFKIYFSDRTRPCGSLSLWQKWVPETLKKIMFLGSKMRPVRGADNLTAIYESIV
jgi:hypothetical protein